MCVCLCAHVCTQHIYKVSLTSQFDLTYELVNSVVTSTRLNQENFLKNKSYSPDITIRDIALDSRTMGIISVVKSIQSTELKISG